MRTRQDLFEIKAGLADILYFGSSTGEREVGGLRSEHWETIKVDGDHIRSLAGYFHSLSGLAHVQYNSEGKLEFIGGLSVRYWDGKITYIGSHPVTYDDEHPHRLKKIGTLLVKYTNDNRIFSIGGERITYNYDCIYDNPAKYQQVIQQKIQPIVNVNKVDKDHDQQAWLVRNKKNADHLMYQQEQSRIRDEKKMKRYDLKCAQNDDLNKQEIPRLLALLIVIVNHIGYWNRVTRIGSMPKGVRELKNDLDVCLNRWKISAREVNHLQDIEHAISTQPLSALTSLLSTLATTADGFFSKDYWRLHQVFRGRDPKVNNFYGIISGLTQHGFPGGSAYYTAKQRYFPNAALQYLNAEFTEIFESAPLKSRNA